MAHDSFTMTSHDARRHPMASVAQVPKKSKSVYYNLQFWPFLGHFWTSTGYVTFSPEMFLGKPRWLIALRGCLAPFLCCLGKYLITPYVHFSRNPKLSWNEHKGIHIFVPSCMTRFQWHPMSLGEILWLWELKCRESLKACIITFNFCCFWDILGLFRA